jgi:hypothetical protein
MPTTTPESEEVAMDNGEQTDYLGCSFCGKGQGEVLKLIAGPAVYICNECVCLCSEILKEERIGQGGPDIDKDLERGQDEGNIALEFSRDEALVLFEWISRCNESEKYTFVDKAEQVVLWNIECGLEEILHEPFASDYDELVKSARNRVRGPSD